MPRPRSEPKNWIPGKSLKSVAAGLRTLIVDKRQLYKDLEADYTKYFKQLIEMDNVQRRLLELTTKYTDYIDERVLWIRTGQAFDGEHLVKASAIAEMDLGSQRLAVGH